MEGAKVRKILLALALVAALATGSTVADATPGHGHAKGHAKKCAKLLKVGFVVRGTFVSADDTSVTLNVTKANRHALRSELVEVGEEFVASPANADRIKYVNRSGPTDAQVGDRVKVVGKVTKLKHGCDDAGFSPTATVRLVVVTGPGTDED
jgi:hypothetical protein